MGKCIYCGENAGFFNDRHEECEKKHFGGIEKIRTIPFEYRKENDFADLLSESKKIAVEHFIDEETRINTIVEGINKLADSYFAEGILSYNEEVTIVNIMKSMDYNFEELNKRVVKGCILRDLSEGIIRNRFKLDRIPIKINKNETMIFAFAAVYGQMVEEEHFEGGNIGFSSEIFKGIYFNTSSFKGHPVIKETLQQKAEGMLFVTDKTIYFYSQSGSEIIPINKIFAITDYEYGIGLQIEGKISKPQIYVVGDGWFICKLISNLIELSKKE